MHAAPAGAFAALLLAVATVPLSAQGLASPGPLSAAHAGLDNLARCLDCHDAGRQLSGRKCLVCHASLAAEVSTDRGYHAVATRHGTQLACRTCHSEHNGRPYRLVKWPDAGGREGFDHGQTGWLLEGAHAKQRCEACHKASLVVVASVRTDSSLSTARTYLGLGTTCAACHLDEHRGRVSRQCADCHSVDAWKPAAKFDHDRTSFPLTGLHADVHCDRCHTVREQLATGPGGSVDSAFMDFRAGRTSRASGCAGCHPSPHHEASMAGRCERCHSAAGWFAMADSVRHFDHTAVGFPLRGAHATARCESCHLSRATSTLSARVALVRANLLRPLRGQRMVFDRCDACHEDPHEGQLAASPAPRDCSACHTETRFSPTAFALEAHDSSRFPLTGAHRATPCAGCHPLIAGAAAGSGQIKFRFADETCAACHRDPHGGQFAGRHVPGARPAAPAEASARTACTPCHDTEAWRPAAFDHDSTRYPLRGAHRALACSRCHRPAAAGRPVRFAGLGTTCDAAGCHVDPHGGQFADRARGSACTSCHTEAAWASLVFDHQRDTDYPLDGAHRNLKCVACHRPEGQPPLVRYRPLPHRCEDCHAGGGGGGRSL
jgi:hypothetical protein